MTPPVTHCAPYTVRVATFSARHRWPVIALWFLAEMAAGSGPAAAPTSGAA